MRGDLEAPPSLVGDPSVLPARRQRPSPQAVRVAADVAGRAGDALPQKHQALR